MRRQVEKSSARDGMSAFAAVLGGAGIGAGLMFLLDPRQGRRRRALIRDQAVRAWHETEGLVQAGVRDAAHRAQGVLAETKAALREHEVDDEILVERIRSKIGRAVTHPNALEIRAERGMAILSGPVLAREVDRLLGCVSAVRGVRGIHNRLEVHHRSEDIPALQGEGRTVDRTVLPLRAWHPATRLLAFGTAGLGLMSMMARSRWMALLSLGALGTAVGMRARGAGSRPQPRRAQPRKPPQPAEPRPQA